MPGRRGEGPDPRPGFAVAVGMPPPPTTRHRCHVYRDPEGIADALTSFLREGLNVGVQCRVVAYIEAPDRAIGALAAAGVDIGDALNRGALDVLPAMGTPLVEMPFDAPAAVDHVRRLTAKAVAASFAGLWLAIDMRWALASAVGEAGLAAFERGLDGLTTEVPLVVLCMYDERLFPPDLLTRATRIHVRPAASA